jgi:hypothetical protein
MHVRMCGCVETGNQTSIKEKEKEKEKERK